MSNKILSHTARLGRESIPPAVMLAISCRIRSKNHGLPEVSGAYKFDKSDYSYEIEKSEKPANVYATPDGTKCTLELAADHLGLSTTRTFALFTEYVSDYEHIYKNYGNARNAMTFKTDDGEKSNSVVLAEYYGVTPSTVSRAYKRNDNDYLKANAELEANRGKAKPKANDYKTEAGFPCSLDECAFQLGLSTVRTCALFTKYNSDYDHIFSNYGKAKCEMNYKDDDGEKSNASKLGKYFGVTASTVRRAYQKSGNDYLVANADLRERFLDETLGF